MRTDGDIPPLHWTGAALDCAPCEHIVLRGLPDPDGCAPGHACMQDAYARRIDRFFRWHPALANGHLAHPYFEVRAIAAVALRLPLAQLPRLGADPHREVRLRVAQRLAPERLAGLREDPDYGVRELVARRLPVALLPTMALDSDPYVRKTVAQRIEMPALLRLADDTDEQVRRVVASRLPVPLLARMAGDADWRVRWEVAQRAEAPVLQRLQDDEDELVRDAARERLADLRGTAARVRPLHGGALHG
jgi:hypothetical protein